MWKRSSRCSNGLPKGRDFSINADDSFQGGLDGPYMATFESEVLYDGSVSGTISPSPPFSEIRCLFTWGSCGVSGRTNETTPHQASEVFGDFGRWQAIDFAQFNRSTVSFFDHGKHETRQSRG
ncbi:hypothetical protein ZIOFF_002764 [Zingiber officinale]|uniref:Uncharacterized protein n=1 Tax=Zingiber officinale TaxID=94328 RepID=A0A8J5I7G0_ZINOF|nr:hypothetical protein ZIOFF_002764 [Zingiber officinale]